MSHSPAATKCAVCGDTGEVDRMAMLDCGYCDAAEQRSALNAFVKANRFEAAADLHWMIHQRAVADTVAKLTSANAAIEITVTVPPQRRASDRAR